MGEARRTTDQTPLHLALFDMDGTLIDSLAQISAAMDAAFLAIDREPPPLDAVRAIIGLDVGRAIGAIGEALGAPLTPAQIARAETSFRAAFATEREAGRGEGAAPLYPGARARIERLAAAPSLLLGVATGKSRHGLDHALKEHDLARFFTTTQTASEAPGKPHPGMIERALAETGVAAEHAVIIGDSSFDMEMAGHAGIAAIGVAWGYHPPEALRRAGAREVIEGYAALPAALAALWGAAALEPGEAPMARKAGG